jgi:hypothetical protein
MNPGLQGSSVTGEMYTPEGVRTSSQPLTNFGTAGSESCKSAIGPDPGLPRDSILEAMSAAAQFNLDDVGKMMVDAKTTPVTLPTPEDMY